MTNVVLGLSRYVLALFMALYTIHCFLGFGLKENERKGLGLFQAFFLVMIHVGGFTVICFRQNDPEALFFCALQEVMIIGFMVLMRILYPKCSRLLINNMFLFMSVGFIMLYRLSYDNHMRQFMIAVISLILVLPVPYLIRTINDRIYYMDKAEGIRKLTYGFGIVGLMLLIFVLIIGQVTRGSRLSISIAGIAFQPSEFVKILFILFLAGIFSGDCFYGNSRKDREIRIIYIGVSAIIAAVHVFLLVLSRDLGGGAILFVIYCFMLYYAVKRISVLFILGGVGAAGLAASYKLFSHVRNRFLAWRDPFSYIEGQGYQITQSLFAIGTGSWFGMGINEGSPDKIPIVERDFIFSAIAEELGGIFAICLILVCISTFLMFIYAAMRAKDPYFSLTALGIAVCYAFQVFLNIGGVTKFIPLTGVTLPLVSYGGSSCFATLIMFALIQGILITDNTGIYSDEE